MRKWRTYMSHLVQLRRWVLLKAPYTSLYLNSHICALHLLDARRTTTTATQVQTLMGQCIKLMCLMRFCFALNIQHILQSLSGCVKILRSLPRLHTAGCARQGLLSKDQWSRSRWGRFRGPARRQHHHKNLVRSTYQKWVPNNLSIHMIHLVSSFLFMGDYLV